MYILQIEEYSSRRLIRWLPRFFFRRNFQIRDCLKYTKRVKLTLSLILFLWLLSLVAIILLMNNLFVAILLIVVWCILTPIFVLVGNTLISPYFENIKSNLRRQATAKIKGMPNLKVVAVAGSYGKTTVKNFIYQLVKYNYRTQMIPGNINTPAGIAGWVNSNLLPDTELLIAEVDAYEIGEIARSCEIVAADIAILTNIGDQHLERFGDESHLALALSEVLTRSKTSAKLLVTEETQQKLKGIGIGIGDREWITVTPGSTEVALSTSNKINLQFALEVTKLLNIPERFISDTLDSLELPDRRQRLTEMYGYEAIDDSYNISFTTAQAGIAAAKIKAQKAGKKLLVLTAGIPELSRDNQDKNKELGRVLVSNADHVVILGSMFADEIVAGVGDGSKYTVVKDLNAFLTETRVKFPSEEWFLLMQPELGDLYY